MQPLSVKEKKRLSRRAVWGRWRYVAAVGIPRQDALEAALVGIRRAEERIRAGGVPLPGPDPVALRWRYCLASAMNAISNLCRTEHRRQQRQGTGAPGDKRDRMAHSRTDTETRPEPQRYSMEVFGMVTGQELELFMLHVVEDYPLRDCAIRMGTRHATVLELWKQVRARWREHFETMPISHADLRHAGA